jgi:hypothetical protein
MADDFELLPADDAELTVDEALDAALDERDDSFDEDDTQRPIGYGWAFDFATGQLVRHGLAPAVVTGESQIRMWIEKTLRTARFAHGIYSDNYGVDFPEDLIGQPFNSLLAGQLSTAIEDALLVHDRIRQVKDFTFTGGPESDLLEISFTVLVDEDELNIDNIPIGRTVLDGDAA